MKTPIFDFVKRYREADVSRFHMPGHKGSRFLGCESMDITEIAGADVLYHADGIIAESEANATALFGTAHTFYSAEGSTLAIKAMLKLVTADRKEERPLILAGRNAHKAFIYGAALLDLDVEWLYPAEKSHLCACEITPAMLHAKLAGMTRKPCAVYITSPDYLGHMADIAGLSAVCRAFRVPLLVDNAHGAYLKFLTPSRHPIDLGATMCCDSAHKTLPVLTGGAYLHISGDAPLSYLADARNALSLFASTSPSYLILQSLDLCNAYLADHYEEKLSNMIGCVAYTKKMLTSLGFAPEESEPAKIVIHAAKYGYTGEALAQTLRYAKVEAEFADDEYLVLMASPENCAQDFERLLTALADLPRRIPLPRAPMYVEKGVAAVSLRDAMLGRQELVDVRDAVGRICAMPTVSCPPAVPIATSGEIITENAVRLFHRYGISKIAVLKHHF